MSKGIQVLTFNFVSFLERITKYKGWREVNGPDSGCGIDYWYETDEHEAYINIDQGEMTVSLDGDRIWEGDCSEAQGE